MSNIKDVRYKPRLRCMTWSRAAMLWNVVVVFRRRRAHAPSIHAASYFDHEKRVAWFSISIHACVLRLAALWFGPPELCYK